MASATHAPLSRWQPASWAVGSLIAVTEAPASAATTVTVNGATAYQTIDGFGISEAFGQANAIRTAGTTTQKQALDLLFSTSSGAGFSILRSLIPSDSGSIEPNAPSGPTATPTYVWSGNDAQDQGRLWLAKQAKNTYGVTTFYNDAWSAPGFMETNGNQANGGSLCGTPGASCGSGDRRQAYANYLVQHAKYWSSAGVTPSYVGFVNEPSLTASYSSMLSGMVQGGHTALTGPASTVRPRTLDHVVDLVGAARGARGRTPGPPQPGHFGHVAGWVEILLASMAHVRDNKLTEALLYKEDLIHLMTRPLRVVPNTVDDKGRRVRAIRRELQAELRQLVAVGVLRTHGTNAGKRPSCGDRANEPRLRGRVVASVPTDHLCGASRTPTSRYIRSIVDLTVRHGSLL